MGTRIGSWVAAFLVCVLPGWAWANVFSMPSGQTSLQFVTVGNPGNLPYVYDTYPSPIAQGAVDHAYSIGKFEITAGSVLRTTCSWNSIFRSGCRYGAR
jgi:hypothetical protein